MVILSLFDRLTDYDPLNSREVPPPEREQLSVYKDSVARDLTNLFNTRRSDTDIPEEYEYVRQSIAAYGVQDFSAAPMDRDLIRRVIERTVRVFEPRLSRVQVSVEKGGDFIFWFRISGMMRVDVSLEPVVYDAELPKESRRFRVMAGR